MHLSQRGNTNDNQWQVKKSEWETTGYGRRGEKAIDINTGGSPGYQRQSLWPGNSPSEEVRDIGRQRFKDIHYTIKHYINTLVPWLGWTEFCVRLPVLLGVVQVFFHH